VRRLEAVALALPAVAADHLVQVGELCELGVRGVAAEAVAPGLAMWSAGDAVLVLRPARLPRPPARTGRASFPASGSPRVSSGRGRGFRDVGPRCGDGGPAVAVTDDRHRRGLPEPHPVCFRPPPVRAVVAPDDPLPASSGVSSAQPTPDSPEQVVLEVVVGGAGRPVPESVEEVRARLASRSNEAPTQVGHGFTSTAQRCLECTSGVRAGRGPVPTCICAR
jgi:hypothetical protein